MRKHTAWVFLALAVTVGIVTSCDQPTPMSPDAIREGAPPPYAEVSAESLQSFGATSGEVLAGPFVSVRSTGSPVAQAFSFNIANRARYEDTATIVVRDVSHDGHVSSAQLLLNGLELWGPSAFPLRHGVDSMKVVVGAAGTVVATLQGKPGTALQISVMGKERPPVLIYSDDFSHGLGNWVVEDPDGLGSWSTPNDELIGDYNIVCGTTTCDHTQLLLADRFQPGDSIPNWRMQIQSNLVEAYCCYHGGAMANLAKFSLWVSNSEKEQLNVGYVWQGLQAPPTVSDVIVNHQAYPWHLLADDTVHVATWEPDEWQTTTLEKHGDTYTVYFNGTLVYQVTRTFSEPPKIGLSTYGKVRMDNFKLWALP